MQVKNVQAQMIHDGLFCIFLHLSSEPHHSRLEGCMFPLRILLHVCINLYNCIDFPCDGGGT